MTTNPYYYIARRKAPPQAAGKPQEAPTGSGRRTDRTSGHAARKGSTGRTGADTGNGSTTGTSTPADAAHAPQIDTTRPGWTGRQMQPQRTQNANRGPGRPTEDDRRPDAEKDQSSAHDARQRRQEQRQNASNRPLFQQKTNTFTASKIIKKIFDLPH